MARRKNMNKYGKRLSCNFDANVMEGIKRLKETEECKGMSLSEIANMLLKEALEEEAKAG